MLIRACVCVYVCSVYKKNSIICTYVCVCIRRGVLGALSKSMWQALGHMLAAIKLILPCPPDLLCTY